MAYEAMRYQMVTWWAAFCHYSSPVLYQQVTPRTM